MIRLVCLIAVLSILAPGFVLAQDSPPDKEIKVVRVTGNIHVFSCWYGRHYVNVTALSGPDGLLLVDTGHKNSAPALMKKLTKSGYGDVKYIINTHFHGDHTGGNKLLGADATIIAHKNVRKRLSEEIADSLESRPAGLPDETFADSMTLSFNNNTVRIIHLLNGHTDGDAIVHFVDADVICLGDLLFSDKLPYIFKNQGGSIDGFINNLGLILNMFPENASFIPGHGRVYTKSELRTYRDMLSGLTERIRTEFQAGKTIDEVFAADVMKEWKDWVSQEYVSDSGFVLMVWDNDRSD